MSMFGVYFMASATYPPGCENPQQASEETRAIPRSEAQYTCEMGIGARANRLPWLQLARSSSRGRRRVSGGARHTVESRWLAAD
jgi:hypothetical protein